MQDAQLMHKLFSNMGVPENNILQLVDPDKVDFYQAIKKVRNHAKIKKDVKIQLFIHFSGLGICNGGYIAIFGPYCQVNLSCAISDLSRECSNVWVLMVFDACATAVQSSADSRMFIDFTGAAAVGTYKTVTIAACRLGNKAFSSWQFTKSFAEFMTRKLIANKGLFEIPEDVFDFEGPNGEHEV